MACLVRSLYSANNARPISHWVIFLIGILGGGLRLGPFGAAVTDKPIVPAPSDCDDGENGGMIGRGNRNTRRKPIPVPLCPPQTPHARLDANQGRRGGKPATNRLSYDTALSHWLTVPTPVCQVQFELL
jgi:hypothetical protein